MTAIGKDARDIAGYNLLSYLADFNNVKKQGLNGPVWALIALKCNPEYKIPEVSGVSDQTTEQKLIDYLVDRELEGGGWALSGQKADSDITAMTMQALAPYYKKSGYEKVTAALDRALDKLSSIQFNTGGFGTINGNDFLETSESVSQVLTAITALGIDPQTDYRFIKNGKWIVENLVSYHIDGSGFMHVKAGAANNGGGEAGKVNGMATEQGFYAMVAYQRLLDGKTSLYDMSDLTVKPGEEGDGSGTGVEDTEKSRYRRNIPAPAVTTTVRAAAVQAPQQIHPQRRQQEKLQLQSLLIKRQRRKRQRRKRRRKIPGVSTGILIPQRLKIQIPALQRRRKYPDQQNRTRRSTAVPALEKKLSRM